MNDPLRPGWLPEGMRSEDTDLSGYPKTFGLVYRAADGGRMVVEASQGPWGDAGPAPAQEPVLVNGEPGTCLQGEGKEADPGALMWSSGGLSYRIRYDGLELTCLDLLHMAGQPGSEP